MTFSVHSLIKTQESPGIYLRWHPIGRETEGGEGRGRDKRRNQHLDRYMLRFRFHDFGYAAGYGQALNAGCRFAVGQLLSDQQATIIRVANRQDRAGRAGQGRGRAGEGQMGLVYGGRLLVPAGGIIFSEINLALYRRIRVVRCDPSLSVTDYMVGDILNQGRRSFFFFLIFNFFPVKHSAN